MSSPEILRLQAANCLSVCCSISRFRYCPSVYCFVENLRKLAGTVGLEPTTTRLTAECSAIELRTHNARILTTGGYEPPGRGIDQAFCKVVGLNQRPFALSVLDRDISRCLRVCCANSYLGA